MERDADPPAQHDPLNPEAVARDEVDQREPENDGKKDDEVRVETVDRLVALVKKANRAIEE